MPDAIAHEIEAQSRAPFRRLLGKHVRVAEATPDAKLQTAADNHPDRYMQGMAILGRLSGYSEKLEIEATLEMNVRRLSDSDLAARYRRLVIAYLRALSPGEWKALFEELYADHPVALPPRP